ncbi:LD-carboxypeptidase LdcB/DacB [Streptococcus suis]|uniref:LD-carboxypeptidase LdcB/DacB n=1 Tax=Streptococcus suis TaxID=1307 RepID=UPI001ABE34F4|nr:M15 family metallopeptidase [Streptococcus suis]
MKKVYSMLLLSCLLLAACSQTDSATETSQESEVSKSTSTSQSSEHSTSSIASSEMESNSTTSTTSGETTSSEQSTTSIATSATYNGSYYSVQGKYGEIIIANKKHPLDPSFAPGENPTALAAFQQLLAAMQEKGFSISTNYSGFRSYETQAGLYQSYVNNDGQAAADTYSARPGYSEHQTGLAFDIMDASGNLLTEPSAANWVANNAHYYGFIVRYLPGKESITGYIAESWHVRYIGQEASDIYQSGLTLEEYFGVPGGDYQY